jgi:hypothetical protein
MPACCPTPNPRVRNLPRILCALLVAAVASCLGAQEQVPPVPLLAGLLHANSTGTLFSIRWEGPNGAMLQAWKRIGDTVGHFSLLSFDQDLQALSVRDATGRTHQIFLREGFTQEGISNAEFTRLNRLRDRDRTEDVPVLSRGKARALWLRLIDQISSPLAPGVVIDIDGATLPPDERRWFLEAREKARAGGRLLVVLQIEDKPRFHDYPRNAFGLPEPMTRNLLPSDWDELALMSVAAHP